MISATVSISSARPISAGLQHATASLAGVRREDTGTETIVRLEGSFDALSSPTARPALDAVVRDQRSPVAIDHRPFVPVDSFGGRRDRIALQARSRARRAGERAGPQRPATRDISALATRPSHGSMKPSDRLVPRGGTPLCPNLNHRRSNAPVRCCPSCGGVVNAAVSPRHCASTRHDDQRRRQSVFCVDCGQRLITSPI